MGKASHPGPESSGVMTTAVDPTPPPDTNEIRRERCALRFMFRHSCFHIEPDPLTRSLLLRLVWDPGLRVEQHWHREATLPHSGRSSWCSPRGCTVSQSHQATTMVTSQRASHVMGDAPSNPGTGQGIQELVASMKVLSRQARL